MDLPVVDTASAGLEEYVLAAYEAETAHWRLGILTFIHDLNDLVASGRIGSDARNVILCKLRRALPMMEAGQ